MFYLLYGLSFFIFCNCSYQAIGLHTKHHNFHGQLVFELNIIIFMKINTVFGQDVDSSIFILNISPPVFFTSYVYIVTQYYTLCSVGCTISVLSGLGLPRGEYYVKNFLVMFHKMNFQIGFHSFIQIFKFTPVLFWD